MKVILISRKHGGSRSIELGRWSRALLSLCCLGLPLGMVAGGYMLGQENEANSMRGMALDGLQDELEQQQKELAALQTQAERKMQAMTLNGSNDLSHSPNSARAKNSPCSSSTTESNSSSDRELSITISARASRSSLDI